MAPSTTRSTRWKDLERTAARKLGGRRIVRADFFERAPDVLVPDFNLVVDAKAHAIFAHHTLLDTIRQKYCHEGQVPVLVTKHAGQHGEYATLPLNTLAALLREIRGYREAAR